MLLGNLRKVLTGYFNIFYILALKGGGSSKIDKVSKEIYLISKLTHISVKTRTNLWVTNWVVTAVLLEGIFQENPKIEKRLRDLIPHQCKIGEALSNFNFIVEYLKNFIRQLIVHVLLIVFSMLLYCIAFPVLI